MHTDGSTDSIAGKRCLLPVPGQGGLQPKGGARGRCPICTRHAPLTFHHLVPKAQKVRGQKAAIMKLCCECHALVHFRFGDGQHFSGPKSEKALRKRMRSRLDAWIHYMQTVRRIRRHEEGQAR